MAKPKPSELAPVDWERVESDYRAGVLSVREIGKRNGVSHTAIQKRAREYGWVRNLHDRIKAKAADLVAKREVAAQVATGNEDETILANAQVSAELQLAQRQLSNRGVNLIDSLLRELETTTSTPELFAQVHDMLHAGPEPDFDKLRLVADVVASLPTRERTARGLISSLTDAINLQRLTYSMDEKQKSIADVDSFESLRDLAEMAMKGSAT